jgi:hypothetical protein
MALALLAFSAFILGNMAPNLTSIVTSHQQASFKTLDLCGTDVQSEMLWGDDKAVGRSGTHYVAMDVTGLLYGVAPGAILLKTPVSFAGVAFTSPEPEAFTTIYSAGFFFVTVTFADGSQHNLSEIMFPPPFNVPGACAELVTHNGVQAGFVLEYSPNVEPLPYPDLGVRMGDNSYQASVHLIVQA